MSFAQARSSLVRSLNLNYVFVAPNIKKMELESTEESPHSKISDPYSQPHLPTSLPDTTTATHYKKKPKLVAEKDSIQHKPHAPIRFNAHMNAQLLRDIDSVGGF